MRKYSIWLLMLMFLVSGLVSGCAELYAVKAKRERKKRYQRVQREIQESDELLSKPVPKKKYHRSSKSAKKAQAASEPIALPAEEVPAPEPKPVAKPKPAPKSKPARRVESSFKPTPEDIEQLRRPGFVEPHDDTEPEPIPVKRPVIRKRVVAKTESAKKRGPVYRDMVAEKKTAKPVVVKKPAPRPAPVPRAKPAPVAVKKPAPKPVAAPKVKPAPVAVKKNEPKPVAAPKAKPAPVVVKKPAPKPAPAPKPKPKKQKLSRNTIGLTDPINIPRAKNAPEIAPPADLMGPIELTRKKRRTRRNLTPKVAKVPGNSMDKKADEELKRMAANIGKKAKPKPAATPAEEVVAIEVTEVPAPVAVAKKPEPKPVKKTAEFEVKEVPAPVAVAKKPTPKPAAKPVVKKSESLGLPFDEPTKAPAKVVVAKPAPVVVTKKPAPKPVKVPPLVVTKKPEPKPVKKIGKSGPVKIPALVVAKKSEPKPVKKNVKVESKKASAPVVAKKPTPKPAAKPVVKKSESLGLPFDEPTKAPAKVVVAKPAPVVVTKKPTPKPVKKFVKTEPEKAPAPVVIAKKPESKKANEKWEIEIVEGDSEIEVAPAPKPKVAKKNIDWSLPKAKKSTPAKPVKAPVYKERKTPPAAPVVQVKLAKQYTKEELAKAAAAPARSAAPAKLPEPKVAPKPITLAKKKDVEVAIAKPVKRPTHVKTAKPKPAPVPKVVKPVADKAVQEKVLKKNDDFMTTSVKGKSKVYLGWPADGMVLRSGMDRLLSWMPANAAKCTDIKLMFSSDNGKTWKSVSRGLKYGKVISWTVPKVNSNKCLLRFVGKDASGQQILATSGVFAVDSGVWSSVEDI